MKYIETLNLNLVLDPNNPTSVNITPYVKYVDWFEMLLNRVEVFEELKNKIIEYCNGFVRNELIQENSEVVNNLGFRNYLSNRLAIKLEDFIREKMNEILSNYSNNTVGINSTYYVFETIDGNPLYLSSCAAYDKEMYSEIEHKNGKKKENRI